MAIWLVVLALATVWSGSPARSQALPSVGGFELVSEVRVTRTVSEYTYRAALTNTGPAILGATATATSLSVNTTVVDGALSFGAAATGAAVASTDTFTFRHNKTAPFAWSNLAWSVAVTPVPPAEGLLQGEASSPALAALTTRAPEPVPPGDIANGVLLTRLDVFLTADATVGQVNAALDAVGARIVSMVSGGGAVTVRVPRQPGITGLETLAQTLMTYPGIRFAMPGLQSSPTQLHASNDIAAARHLVPARFPAAWNAGSLTVGCQPVPLVIQDQFLAQPAGFSTLFPGFPNLGGVASGDARQDEHGYHMFAVAAAPLGLAASPGTNPFTSCIDVRPIQKGGTTLREELQQLVNGLPAGQKSVVSYSMSLPGNCKGLDTATNEIVLVDCDPAGVLQSILAPVTRAELALEWKRLTRSRWAEFLVAASASNERNDGLSGVDIYPGVARAANVSAMTIAAKADPLFAFALDASQWRPSQDFLDQGFPSLEPDIVQMDALRAAVRAAGLETVRADNVVIVGGLTTLDGDPRELSPGFETLQEADFSNSDPDVKTVATSVAGACVAGPCQTGNGNSRAAPQIAGLATYLWALSPALRQQPASVTRQAIVDNARNTETVGGILDAYASVLSLDPTGAPDPATWTVRKAILDVNTGGASAGRFDEADIAEFLNALIVLDGSGAPVNPATADFGRYDLNGDGFTGGTNTERFDLDRGGSTRFGASVYEQVTQNVLGASVEFNEHDLTDLDVLCYYAYSPLFAGSPEEREYLLDGRCAPVSVVVSPASIVVAAGGTATFGATVLGASNQQVTWDLPNGGGTIDAGVFTAGSTGGTFVVRARSAAAPSATGTATGTVMASTSLLLSGHVTATTQVTWMNGDPYNYHISVAVEAESTQGGGLIVHSATGNASLSDRCSYAGPVTGATFEGGSGLWDGREWMRFRPFGRMNTSQPGCTSFSLGGIILYAFPTRNASGQIISISFGYSESYSPPVASGGSYTQTGALTP